LEIHESVPSSAARRVDKTRIWAAVGASVLAGVGKGLWVRAGLDAGYYDVLAFGVIGLALFWFFPEPWRLSRISAYLLVSGILMGVAYVCVFYLDQTLRVTSTHGVLDVYVKLLAIGVVIPLFEEKVVRDLLFKGIAAGTGNVVGALVSSVLFGLAHTGIFVFAFCIGLLMCWLTARKIGTVDRALLHGSYNLTLTIGQLLLAGVSLTG